MALARTFLRTIAPRRIVIATLLMIGGAGAALAEEPAPAPAAANTLLNASYDVSRELYKDINAAFIADWQKKTGETVTINQSHGGSTKQALAVANGLEADVVTFNQAPDIDVLVKQGGLVSADWRKKFPNGAAPFTTTSIFLVRNGNPKGIKDWDDLAKAGVEVIVPNPKTSGNGRYTYLAAWGYGLKMSGNEAGAKEFVGKLFGYWRARRRTACRRIPWRRPRCPTSPGRSPRQQDTCSGRCRNVLGLGTITSTPALARSSQSLMPFGLPCGRGRSRSAIRVKGVVGELVAAPVGRHEPS